MADLPQRVHVEPEATRVLLLLPEAPAAEAATWLDQAGYAPLIAKDLADARRLVTTRLDLEVAIVDATQAAPLLEVVAAGPEGLEVILVGPGDVFTVTQAIAAGAFSYLSWPLTQGDLMYHVLRAIHHARHDQLAEEKRRLLPAEVRFEGIVGSTPRMREVMQTLRKSAPTDAPIVILGETGTGKELVARAVHESSGRKNGPFVALHLHATPAGLVESELFGHKKGAFTGALGDRVGKLEQAHGGTLFLDELGDIPLETQTKLLRVLETHTFEPVGSNKSVTSDFRLIAATNQDIERLIAEKKFRDELWYRIRVIRVELPPLRERRPDIPLLVDAFLREYAARYGKQLDGIEADALAALQRQPWPGNIRDLRNVVHHMVVLSEGPRLTWADLPVEIRGGEAPGEGAGSGALAGRPMDDIEREAIRATLELVEGNRKKAAELLQIGERTLYRKIEKFGL